MQIDLIVINDAITQVMKVVRESLEPPSIGTVLDAITVPSTGVHKGHEIAVAVIWHLLAKHALEFTEKRRLRIPPEYLTDGTICVKG